MKKFKIQFDFNEDYFETVDYSTFERIKELNKNGYEVETFEDYYNLLEEIGELTDGQYYIYNNGTYISSD